MSVTKEKIIYGVLVKSKKHSLLMRIIGFLIKPFNPYFLTSFWTTLFDTIYAPSSFDLENESLYSDYKDILEHEKIHVDDFKKYHIWFLLTYFFPPFLLAYGRFYWERKAYLPELQKLIDNHQYTLFWVRLEYICSSLAGPKYFWTWPKSLIKKWFLMKTNMS